MPRKLRILVLGTGGMARAHAEAFKDDPRVELAGGVDVDLKRAKAFAKAHDMGKAFGSLAEALDWGRFDAVANVTPDPIHHPTTMPLLKAGKHVLCEKPLAENYPLADEMATAADKAGVVNMVNLTYRNVAALQKARKLIADGEIGAVRHVEASYRQSWLVSQAWGDWRTEPKWLWRLSEAHGSRGVLGDVGIHILDFATYAIDRKALTVQAQLKTFDKARGNRIGEYGLDANDSATMALSFEGGVIGVVHTSRFMTGYHNTLRLHVFGDRGGLEIEHGQAWTTLRVCSGDDVHKIAWREVIAEPVRTIYRKFVDAILDGGPQDPDFRRAADLQKIIDACYTDEAQSRAVL